MAYQSKPTKFSKPTKGETAAVKTGKGHVRLGFNKGQSGGNGSRGMPYKGIGATKGIPNAK